MNIEKFYSVDDIAEMLSITSRTVRTYLRNGTLKGRKVGGQWRFTEEDIQAMFQSEAIVQKVKEDSTQLVFDFLDKPHSQANGSVRVCSVIDIFLPCEETAKKSEQLCSLYAADSTPDDTIRYHYDHDEGKGRFVIVSSPAFMEKAMKILR